MSMNIEKLYTAAIFFPIEPISTTGNWLCECQSRFHLHGLARAATNTKQARNEKWNILVHSGIQTRYIFAPSAYKADAQSIAQRDLISRIGFKFYLRYLLIPRFRCIKVFCRVLHFVNTLQLANFYIGQTSKSMQMLYRYNTWQNTFLALPRGTGKQYRYKVDTF